MRRASRHAPQLVRLAASGVLVALLSMQASCVPVPVKPAAERRALHADLPDHVPDFIRVGHTTRADVRATLGPPDGVGADERWWAFSRLDDRGGTAWVAPLPNLPFTANVAVTERQLVVRFGDDGVVSSATLKSANCPAVTVDFRALVRMGCMPLGDEAYESDAAPAEPPLDRFEQVHLSVPMGRAVDAGAVPRRGFVGNVTLTDRSLQFAAIRSVSLDHPRLPLLRIPYRSIVALRQRVDGAQTFLEVHTRAGFVYDVLVSAPTAAWRPFGPTADLGVTRELVSRLQERTGLR